MRHPLSRLDFVAALLLLLVVVPPRSVEVSAVATETNYTSQVVLIIQTTEDSDNDMTTVVLSHRFRTIYNSFNNNTEFCDPLQRSVTHVQVEEINTTTTTTSSVSSSSTTSTTTALVQKTFLLSTVGTCIDCTPNTNLFAADEDAITIEFFPQLSRTNPCIRNTTTNQQQQQQQQVRGPTIQAFQQAFQASIDESINNTSTTPNTTGSTSATSASAMTVLEIQEQNAFWCTDEITPFNTTLTLDYYSVCETVEWDLVEQILLETYNTMLETDYCDPTFRVMESVLLVETNRTEERMLTLTFDISGSCRGCSEDSLFHTTTISVEQEKDTISFGPLQRRQLLLPQASSPQAPSPPRQLAMTGPCACPTNVTNRAPTQEEFKAEIDSILATVFKGVQCNVDCPVTNRSVWEDLILLELTVRRTSTNSSSCASNTTASTMILEGDTALMADLESSYMEIYNELQSDSYCDPYGRQLTSVDIVSVGEMNALGNIPIEIKLVGTCVDCDGLDMRVYDHPRTQITGNTFRRRRLQSVMTCTCPILSVYDYVRAPFEAEFVSRYQQIVQQLDEECVDSVAECNYGTTFSTGIYLNATINAMNLTDADIHVIAESFEMALNLGYASNEVTCDSQFRTIDQVIAKVVSPNSQQLVEESTTLQRRVVLNLFVSGICNGCGNKLFVGDTSADGRRRHLLVDGERHLLFDGKRRLQQQMTLATSNCYCPLGATIVNEAPPSWRIPELFEMVLDERVVPIVQIHSLLEFNVPSPEFANQDGSLFQECFEYDECGIV